MPRTSWKQQHRDAWNATQRAWRARNGSQPPGGRRRPYSAEEDRLIRDSAEPVTVLARRLGRSAASVYNRRVRLGLTQS